MKKLHILIAALLAALTVLPFSATPAQARHQEPKRAAFTLNAEVLDGGQQIVSLTIRTGQGYSARLKSLIDKVVKTRHIDRSRIYVTGASNGGYMTPRLVVDDPGLFAAEVPIAPALIFNGATMISDAELASVRTPTWVVQSKDDPVLPFEINGKHMAATIPGSLLSAYDTVTWDGVTYNGHRSWIYAARNDPRTDSGLHLWQWMAKQSLKSGHHK